MEREPNLLIDSPQGCRNPLLLAILSVIELRNSIVHWAHGYGAAGLFLIPTATALAVGVAAWMVARFSPGSAGRQRHSSCRKPTEKAVVG